MFSVLLSATVPGATVHAGAPNPSESVYQINPWVDGAIIVTAGLGTLLPWAYADKLIHPKCPCDPNSVNAFDRPATRNASPLAGNLSDITVAISVLAPAIADAAALGVRRELLEDAVVYAEALSVCGALVTLAKYTTQRPLPIVYAGRAPDLIDRPGGYRSFYSGHTTLGFTALTTFAWTYRARYGPAWWPWIITAVGGGSIAVERVAAGRHFYSDVLVGALTGFAVGTVVPLLHARNWGIRVGGSFSEQHASLTVSGRL
jgi:membrane-associated phospholipid phosphatase